LVNPLEQNSRVIAQTYQFLGVRRIEVAIVHTPNLVIRSRGSRENQTDRHDDDWGRTLREEDGMIDGGERKSELREETSHRPIIK